MELVFSLLTIILVNFLGWITPGPNMFVVIVASLTHGRSYGLITGLGLAFASLIWATLAVLGVAILFDLFPTAILTLKLAGATYLVWLGIRSIRNANQTAMGTQLRHAKSPSFRKSFYSGFTVSITNPKAALFYSSIMTAFIPPTSPDWFLVLVVMICVLLAVIFHSITATLFSTRTALSFFKRFQSAFSYAFGAIFVSLGGAIAYAALRKS